MFEDGVGTLDPAGLESVAVAAGAREPGAFDVLAHRLEGRIMALAVFRLNDRHLAEEAVQETLVRMYRALPGYQESNILAWCMTIAHRVCSNLARRERRHARLRLLSANQAHADEPSDSVDVSLVVERALAELPDQLRTTFLLHHQGLEYADVAQILGIPVGTVRSRLFRAREALRVSLAGVFHVEQKEGKRA